MRIALGMYSHEANSFCPQPADLANFQSREFRRGAELLTGWQNTRTEQAGILSVLTAEPGCEVVPLFGARGLSSGPILADVFHALLDELLSSLRASLPVDGVVLVLHGAMMAEDTPDATGEVLARVRAIVGPDVPVFGTLDLHANVTEQMVRQATGLVGYHTAPHVDMYETGQQAARLLLATLKGQAKPTMALVRLPMLCPPENSTHNWGPLAAVINPALEAERQGTILHGAVYPVQPWLDTDVASSVVVITHNDRVLAQSIANDLARRFWAGRAEFVTELVPPDEAVRRALARPTGTVVFCDSADSTTSGSTGDSTAILQALLDAAPVERPALVNVVDPEAVAQAIEAGIGATVTLSVGGKLSPEYFQPVTFTGQVQTISEGTFYHKGPGMRGVAQHRGRTVVLAQGGIHLVVMEHQVSQWDPELYRSLGLEPCDACIVQAKSPMAFRAAYEGIYDEVLVIDAPGAASPKLAALPWKHVVRPLYPLDPETTWP